MHVGLVTPLYRPAIGGAETHVEKLATGLAAAGHDVEVLTQAHEPALAAEERRAGVVIRGFPALTNHDHYRVAPGLMRFLARSAASWDVLHAHNYHAWPRRWRLSRAAARSC